jgi:long-subunit acyl-CoA synthetase (AMP-forming)
MLSAFAPDAAAVVDDRGALTARDLQQLATDERRWLAASGARRFGLLADNGRAWAVTDLALLAGGLVNVPLPHHFSAAQLAHALDGAGVERVATDDPQRILALDLGFVPAGESPSTGLALLARRVNPDTHPLPAGTVKVTYTSGSTADPKGVCLSRAALEAVARSVTGVAATLGIRRHLGVLPLATLLENVAGLYAAWLAGATCHLPSPTAAAIARGSLAPAALLAAVNASQPESMILVPELLRILVGGVGSGWTPPPSLRFLAVGGARVSPELLARAAAAGLPVFEGYGLSECASVVCLNTPRAARRGSVGRALPHARLRLDAHGEIHVGGAVMGGYIGARALPAGAEIATGDLGEIDAEGFVYVRGRIKNLFITSYGRNLSPEWIESELTQEPVIGQAIACGEGEPHVVALIAPVQPGVPEAAIAAAVERANARLPGYARVAAFHVIAERPSVANGLLTGNGRPRRERIMDLYRDTIARLHARSAEACLSTND